MARKNRTKLVSLDDECWKILEVESKPRMQSVYVRNAIRDYYRRRQADTTTLLEIEQQEIIKDVLDQRDEAIMKIKGLEKRLSQHIENEKATNINEKKLHIENEKATNINEKKLLRKWWHFFFVGFRK